MVATQSGHVVLGQPVPIVVHGSGVHGTTFDVHQSGTTAACIEVIILHPIIASSHVGTVVSLWAISLRRIQRVLGPSGNVSRAHYAWWLVVSALQLSGCLVSVGLLGSFSTLQQSEEMINIWFRR